MIYLGSLVAAGVSKFKSHFNAHYPFSRFRNSEDRINFIAAGAAAGIASAFGAPVCGLLFATEEVFFVCGKTSFPGKVSSVAQPCN